MFDIAEFDSYKEDNRREIKKAKDSLPLSIWETYSAFANSYGGIIILGIEEHKDGSRSISGVNDPDKLVKEFWDLINNRSKVSINIIKDRDVRIYKNDGKAIIVVNVPKATREQKPVYINDDMFFGTYRRNGEGDYLCTKNEVISMLRDQTDDTPDMKMVESITVEELNKETLQSYRQRHVSCRPGHPWENLDNTTYLERLGAAVFSDKDNKFYPTVAGLLMFGEEYQITREFPEYFLDYREELDPSIRWTDRLQSTSGDWSGNLFDFYFRVYNKLTKDIKVPFKLEGGNRVDDTPVHHALREALANCLINTDYYGVRGIVIRKEKDCIYMENPGDIRTGKHQMLKGGISDPRNKTLMKMFNMINIGERAGSGVPDIYETWNNEGWEAPVVEECYNPNRTILKLPLISKVSSQTGDKKPAIKTGDKKPAIKNGDKKISEKTKEKYAKILDFMEIGKEYKLTDFCNLLNLKESRTKEIIADLIKMGRIKVVGTNKNRVYVTFEQQ